MKKVSLIFLFFLLASCINTKSNIVIDGKLWTAIYQKEAAEYDALSLQAYNIARFRLQQALSQNSDKPKAIVTDIDETVLNNNPYSIKEGLVGKSYDSMDWIKWANKAEAKAIKGAIDFFNYAAENKVEIFYITNRQESLKVSTIENLQKKGFPLADDIHVIMRAHGAPKSKESRRKEISAKYDIVLFLGDDLADFSNLFDNKTVDERLKNVDENSKLFGDKFIILPNPNYGDWEDAIYQYKNLSIDQKNNILKEIANNNN